VILFGHLVVLVVTLGLVCRVALALFTPVFYAPDEQSHFACIKYIYENRGFPTQTSKTGAPTNDWEYYQPPLYYVASLPLFWGLSYLGASTRFKRLPLHAVGFFAGYVLSFTNLSLAMSTRI